VVILNPKRIAAVDVGYSTRGQSDGHYQMRST
jgi:hypothetical protein